MNKYLPFILRRIATASVLGLVAASPALSQIVVGPYFGFNQTTIPASLVNPVDAFQTGAAANNNIALNGTANDFTLTFTQGLNVGTARFVVTDNYGSLSGGNHVLRQFSNAIEGPLSTGGQLTITLDSIFNLDSVYLSYVQVTGAGINQYTSVLPSGVSSTAFNSPIDAATGTWSVGQSFVISHLALNTNTFNVQGLTVTGTPVPEPSTAAMALGAVVLGVVAFRRLRR